MINAIDARKNNDDLPLARIVADVRRDALNILSSKLRPAVG
jgi:hypothetical protein